MRARAAVRVVLALVLAASGAGCAARGPSLPSPLPTDVPFAYHLQTERGGDGALLEGTLELVDGCLVVLPVADGASESPAAVVPLLPVAVTTWDGTSLTVEDETVAVGEPIALGGGFRSDRESAAHVPAGCPAVDGENTFGVAL